MKRIAIIGCGGGGKSTLARAMEAELGLPVIHLDAMLWRAGWVMTPPEEELRLLQEFVARPAWVIDGNYGATMDVRLASADTVVFLDMPRWLCVWRVLKRRVQYAGRARPDMAAGCPEKVDWEFLRWIWNYRARQRPEVLARLEPLRVEGKVVVHLQSPAEVRRFLAGLRLAQD